MVGQVGARRTTLWWASRGGNEEFKRVLGEDPNVLFFIRNRFSSVWSLEIFLALHSSPDRDWTIDELVEKVRGSETVVRNGAEELLKGELAVGDGRGGRIRFAGGSREAVLLAEPLSLLYRRMPEGVRRIIRQRDGSGAGAARNNP